MSEIKQTLRASRILNQAYECSKDYRHEFILPEHLLVVLTGDYNFHSALSNFFNPYQLEERLKDYLETQETLPEGTEYVPEPSVQMGKLIELAVQSVTSSSADALDIPHLIRGLLALQDSWAAYLLKVSICGLEANFMSQLIDNCDLEDQLDEMDKESDDPYDPYEASEKAAWRRLVTCMNDHVESHNPLIGREAELERTIQVLCRCDKNNPLHVGEPGVGKTALVWGLARRINSSDVPQRLKDSKIYQLDMGTLLAGTQYRGDFENRIKMIMDGISEEDGSHIVYIDEIHTLVGAGATGDSSLDASNMLKPYLEAGNIRFIGSTTYEEFNKHFSKSKGLVRRFLQIDISEPSINETKHILRQLRPKYEAFHGVVIEDDAIDFAVEASAKYINDRFLPDKAIDLVDEAGAAREISPSTQQPHITKSDIADILAKTCKVNAMAMNNDGDNSLLENLSERILSKIYGQDEAVRQVVEAVQMARAGLLDDNKPQASLLFVGPTGVGKTEVARVLARELNIELVRFDMSEYTEEHAVAKFIGSPAGYVGYEDGGLLVDAIRKTPHCVLLLDEIEKAHQKIYNILLQVMDYARLTDNKGRKADFRNVVIIMTSNAGAQYASQANIGFSGHTSRGEAMLKQVKKTFKPEFLNRLSGTVVFHDMDKPMATRILRKKLDELQQKLTAKGVKMTLTDDAFEHLLSQGFTREYGAREMDRVISQQLKPLLMREILFGSLKQGGVITIETHDHGLQIRR